MIQMEKMKQEILEIVPSVDQILTVKRNIKCSVEGCDKLFPHAGSLHLHLVKSHRQLKSVQDERLFHGKKGAHQHDIHYHCPADVCAYNKGSKKFFTTFALLKQHYKRVHGERKFQCTKCPMTFCLDYERHRHEDKCGVMYCCGSCPVQYTTREALLMHCKRQEHTYPTEYQRQKKTATNKRNEKSKEKGNEPTVTITQTPIVIITAPVSLFPPPSSFSQTQPTDTSQLQGSPLTLSQSIATTPKDSTNSLSPEMLNKSKPSALKMSPPCSLDHLPSGRQSVVIQTDIYGIETLTVDNSRHPVYTGPYSSSGSAMQHSPSSFSGVKPGKSPRRRRKSLSRDMNVCSPRRKKAKSSTGMQTSVSLTKKRGTTDAMSTQTPGDFILETAMKQAEIKITKRTIGSQVTPRKNFSSTKSDSKSSEIQTFLSGFRPQFVDSSSQVQHMNLMSEVLGHGMQEQETMTDQPLSAGTQTMQSFLEHATHLEHLQLNTAHARGIDSKTQRVEIFNENLESSVKFHMPNTSRSSQSGRTLKSSENRYQTASNVSVNLQADGLLSAGTTADSQVQAMSASEFDLLLQSSGIFLDNKHFMGPSSPQGVLSNIVEKKLSQTSVDTNSSTDIDFLSVEATMTDMNTQTGQDFSLFHEIEAIDSNTQTVHDVDFMDLVMSNMETQTLNEDDLGALGLADTYSNMAATTHSMAIGTSDFDSSFDALQMESSYDFNCSQVNTCTMGVGTSDFDLFNNSPEENNCKDEILYASKLPDVLSFATIASQTCENGNSSFPVTIETDNANTDIASHSHIVYSQNNGTEDSHVASSDLGGCGVVTMETQTESEMAEPGFVTTNMETQTTFEDLSQLCEMMQ